MWDDEDYDPSAQLDERVADAVAVVGIIDEVKKDPEAEKPAEKTAQKPVKPTTATHKAYKDLSKAEIEELQKRNDMEMFAGVLGMEVEKDRNAGDTQRVEEAKQFEALEKEIKEKEQAAKPQKVQQPKQPKKKVNTAVYDDYVDDDYDDFDDKYANY